MALYSTKQFSDVFKINVVWFKQGVFVSDLCLEKLQILLTGVAGI